MLKMNEGIEKRIEIKTTVSRKTGGPIRTGPGLAWPDYPSWLRALEMGGCRAENGARTALFVYLASLFRRSQNRLFEGDAHPRRIQAGEDHKRHPACTHGVRLRKYSQRPPRRSVPQE